jgi:hypothetical protein
MADDYGEEEQPKAPAPEPDGKRIFLSHCNSYEGQALFKEMWNKETCREERAAHTFIGTVKSDERTPTGAFNEPDKRIKQVAFDRSKEFRDTLLSCNVIVYDLMSNDFEEVDYVIKTLKTSNLQEQKTLVLLSSVMTWVNTPPKFKEEKVEGEEEEEIEEEPEEEEEEKEEEEEEKKEEDENGEEIVIAKPIFFKETDFHLRVPHSKF